MDAPRDFLFYLIFSPNEQRAGGGERCQTFFFFFSCSADHERDWPPCKVVFFGLATNALNVRNNNNNCSVRTLCIVNNSRLFLTYIIREEISSSRSWLLL